MTRPMDEESVPRTTAEPERPSGPPGKSRHLNDDDILERTSRHMEARSWSIEDCNRILAVSILVPIIVYLAGLYFR